MITGKHEAIKMTVKAGESFQIKIWEDRTKGHRWVPSYDTALLRVLSDEYERMRNIRVTDSGMHYFEFLGMKPGTTMIDFESRYGWKFSADNHLSYEVVITN